MLTNIIAPRFGPFGAIFCLALMLCLHFRGTSSSFLKLILQQKRPFGSLVVC